MEAVTANGFGRSPRGRAWCAVIGLLFVSFRDGASIPCARPIARKERWPLRQHRQHRLRPYWAPAGVGASRSTSVVATGICRDLRAVDPSQHRMHYR